MAFTSKCGSAPQLDALPQIAGVVVAVAALTVYMGFQWRQSRQAAVEGAAPAS